MTALTARGALPYPELADLDTPRPQLEALAKRLAEVMVLFSTADPRPNAGVAGRLHRHPTTGVLSYDTGTAWEELYTRVDTEARFANATGDTFTGTVNVQTGQLQEGGKRVYSPNNPPVVIKKILRGDLELNMATVAPNGARDRIFDFTIPAVDPAKSELRNTGVRSYVQADEPVFTDRPPVYVSNATLSLLNATTLRAVVSKAGPTGSLAVGYELTEHL